MADKFRSVSLTVLSSRDRGMGGLKKNSRGGMVLRPRIPSWDAHAARKFGQIGSPPLPPTGTSGEEAWPAPTKLRLAIDYEGPVVDIFSAPSVLQPPISGQDGLLHPTVRKAAKKLTSQRKVSIYIHQSGTLTGKEAALAWALSRDEYVRKGRMQPNRQDDGLNAYVIATFLRGRNPR